MNELKMDKFSQDDLSLLSALALVDQVGPCQTSRLVVRLNVEPGEVFEVSWLFLCTSELNGAASPQADNASPNAA